MKLLTIMMVVVTLVAALATTGCTRQETNELGDNATSSARVRPLDESNFDAEVRSGVVLVDFWATVHRGQVSTINKGLYQLDSRDNDRGWQGR